ncbi:MAG: tetratricopeptide repeat protein [Bryobacteraceae bacterium]
MKQKRKENKSAPPTPVFNRTWLNWILAFAAAAVTLQVYSPALDGPFVFDDSYLPMNSPKLANQGLMAWISGVRPVLMATYYVNHAIARTSTFGFHVWSILFHVGCAIFIFLVSRRILKYAGVREDFAWFTALVFLLHPVQTEVVAYIAGRSESVSSLFFYAAFALFLYRPSPEIKWARVAAVFALFGLALASKEHTVTLPVLLLLTDFFWNPGFTLAGIKRNWRLHAPVLAGAALGGILVLRRIDPSAGFSIEGLRWYEYLFTQFRVIWEYVRIFLLPVGLSADYDYPISHTIAEHGAAFGLAGLLLVTAAALYYARRFPLASYGWLIFLLLLAPTSSLVPIKDPIADRRLYLPMLGLLLIAVDGLRRLPLSRKAMGAAIAAVSLAAATLTYQRASVWGNTIALWEDTVAKSPRKSRAHFQLAHAYFTAGRCQDALREYEAVSKLEKPDDALLIDWGLAYVCLDQAEPAVEKFEAAAKIKPTAHVYSQIGLAYGKVGRAVDARKALEKALAIDPNYDMTYVYLGHLFLTANNPAQAIRFYEKALALNPDNPVAPEFLATAKSRFEQQQQQNPAVSITPTPR